MFLNIFGSMRLFTFFNTQTMDIKQSKPNSTEMFELYTLAGFEPGSSVPEAAPPKATSQKIFLSC
jgi:hypothetical protein